MNKKVIILGGGPAGLAAGLILARNDIPVEIIDAESNIGGLSASIKFKGYIFDYGGHRLCFEDDAILNKIKNIIGDELKLRKRKSSIFIRGKFIDYPLRFRNLLFNMNPVTLFAAVLDYLLRFIKNRLLPVKEKNLKDWTINRFGKVLFNIYFRPYTEKFWGLPIDKMSIAWASKRITLAGFWDVMVRLFMKKKSKPATYITEFLYPDRGIGRVFEKMADEIVSRGGKIILNSKVTGIELKGDTAGTVFFERDGERHAVNSDYIISTIPITELVNIFLPKLDMEYLEIADSLKYRSLIFVFLIINKKQITNDSWLYFPEKEYIFTRISEPKNWSSLMAPQDKTSLCVEITDQVNGKIWNIEDSEILQEVVKGLADVKLLKREDIEEYFITRWKYAYPIYTGDYKENLGKILTYLLNIKNLSTCGRQGMFNYDTMPDAIKMGFETGEKAKAYFQMLK